jgi:hypothetical protein
MNPCKARSTNTHYFPTYAVLCLVIQNVICELKSCLKFQLLKVLGLTCKYNATLEFHATKIIRLVHPHTNLLINVSIAV